MKSNRERLKSIVTNISTSIVLKGVDLLVDFISIPIALKLVGVSNYGFWLLIFSLQNWLNILDTGVKNSVRNRLATIEPGLRKQVISSSYVITVAITLAMLVITFLVATGADFLGFDLKLESDQNQSLILAIIGVALGLRPMLSFINAIFLSFHLPRVVDMLATIGKVVVLLCLVLMLQVTKDGDAKFYVFLILSLFIPQLIQGMANLYYYNTKFKSMAPSWRQVDLGITREILKSGSSFMLLTAGRIVLLFSNSLLIGYFFDYERVAEVQIGFKIFNYLIVFLAVINNPFWNHFTEKYKLGDLDWIKSSLKRLLQGWLILAVIAVIMSLNLNFLVSFITGDIVSVSSEVAMSLCLFTLMYTLNLIFTSFINSTEKLRIHKIVILVCIVVTAPLAWLLAIKLGLGVNGILISSNIVIAIILAVKIYHTLLLLKRENYGIWAGKLPNTFIVGAGKCGTTSLAKYLSFHPEVYLPSIKEPRFMVRDVLRQVSRKDPTHSYLKNYSVLDENAYKGLYTGLSESIRIDASIHYLYHFEEAIGNILRYSGPESKIIIMLRNPVKRAISNWVYQEKDLLEFGRSLELEEKRMRQNFDSFWFYAQAGLYFNQVKSYMEEFENVHICLFEEFVKNPHEELRKIYGFLELQPLDLSSHRVYNESNNSQAIPSLSPSLNTVINQSQFINSVFRFMDKRSLLPKYLYKTKDEAITQSDIDLLNEYYRSDIGHLEKLLNKNLTSWSR